MLYYAQQREPEANWAETVTLPAADRVVDLGGWLYNLRYGTQPRWALPILEELGMKNLPAPRAQPQAADPAADPAAAGPAGQPGEAWPQPVPVFSQDEAVIDQARREEAGGTESDAELADAELADAG